jgi:hypothetical protein
MVAQSVDIRSNVRNKDFIMRDRDERLLDAAMTESPSSMARERLSKKSS